ncbi:hypothetical protein MPNTM1_01963 [Mycolicibacterium parafortuitum]|uniref:hypothetical protein n=1 Tax=Mycolicibacterium parafortuitum TaxID=39692 RepID=UPI0032C41D49
MSVPTKYFQGIVQVVAGLALAAFPAFFLAIFARIAPIEQQGFLAVALAIGSYAAAVLCAFVVESPLATPGAAPPRVLPRWMAAVTAGSGALLVFGPSVPSAPILFLGVVGLSSGLLMARSIDIVTGRWKTEALAAAILLTGCTTGLVLSFEHNPHSARVLVIGVVLAVLTRLWRAPRDPQSLRPHHTRRAAWVTGETAVVGAVQPALTSLILVILGPAASVTFRVVSTITGALEPIIAYGRMRLLAHGHRGEITIVAAIFAVGVAVLFGAALAGLWHLIFGPAWSGVTYVGLLFACLWKLLMLVTTVPFAALRREGQTAVVFWVRCLGTLVYMVLGVSFVLIFRTPTAAFIAFALAEAVSFPIYYLAAKRTTGKIA